MKRIIGLGLFILMIGLLSACNDDDSSKEPASEPATASAGDDIFQKSCITCHSSGDITGGQVKLDSAKIHADFQKKEELLGFVQKNMPKSSPGSLSKEQYDAVVNYLWDQKQ